MGTSRPRANQVRIYRTYPRFVDQYLISGTEEMPTSIPSTPSPTKVDDVASDVETLDNNGDGPYAKHYRPDARIWRLYLEEAGAEDKELITIWESGLDSLLLFVSRINIAAALCSNTLRNRRVYSRGFSPLSSFKVARNCKRIPRNICSKKYFIRSATILSYMRPNHFTRQPCPCVSISCGSSALPSP